MFGVTTNHEAPKRRSMRYPRIGAPPVNVGAVHVASIEFELPIRLRLRPDGASATDIVDVEVATYSPTAPVNPTAATRKK